MEEINLHTVSDCCRAPCKYRKGIIAKTNEEVMIPFCCMCEKPTKQQEVRLSKAEKERNKRVLLESIFPGISSL